MTVEIDDTGENIMRPLKRKTSDLALVVAHKKKCVEDSNTFKNVCENHGISFDNKSIPYEKLDLIINEISEEVASGKINLDEIIRILDHFSVRQYFKHNLVSYSKLIALLSENCGNESRLSLLRNETIFHRNLIFGNDFYKHFLNINFPNLVHLLGKSNDSELFKEICKTFEKIILHRHQADFETFLNGILKISEMPKEKLNIQKDFFKMLKAVYNSGESESELAFKIVFQSSSNAFKNFGLIYKFLIVTLELLGFDLSCNFEFHKISKYKFTDIDKSKSFKILSGILEVIKLNKIELSHSVKITFSEFLENIVKSVINSTKIPDELSYRILISCIEINPLLAEMNLDNLINFSMKADNSSCFKTYEEFLLKIFETYSKLHRIQNLISKMLPALKTHKELHLETYYDFRIENNDELEISLDFSVIYLPDTVLNYFMECIVQLASWQVMNLFKTFTFHLESTLNEEWNSNFLEFLSKLFSSFLQSIRMAEHTVGANVMEKFNSSMKSLKETLSKFGGELLKREHDQKLVRAFLDLSHKWSEMYMVFCYYNRNFVENAEMFSTFNENYIHSFLTEEQWVLLSQRIENFGESNCKHLIAQLMVQKLKMNHLFGGNQNENIQKETLEYLIENLNSEFEYILNEKFIVDKLLCSFNFEILLRISEEVMKREDLVLPNINSEMLVNATIYTIFTKISKTIKGSLFSTVFSKISKSDVENQNEELLSILKICYEENLWNAEEKSKGSIEKLMNYSKKLKCLPVLYLNKIMQSIFLYCIFSLHQNFWRHSNELKKILEEIIIGECVYKFKFEKLHHENIAKGTLQTTKLDLMELFEPTSLIRNLTTNFSNKRELILILSENVVKNESSLRKFEAGVAYLLENIEDGDNSIYAISVLNEIQKAKKTKKISNEFKQICEEISQKILGELLKQILNKKPNPKLAFAFQICLKHSLNSEKYENLEKLMDLLDSYTDLLLDSQNKIPEGFISLFITILHNKKTLNFSQKYMRLWHICKENLIKLSENQDFSQLICLIFQYIPNECFQNITDDLLKLSIGENNEENPQFFMYLNIWSSIVNSSFNPTKSEIWQQALEKFLIKIDISMEKNELNRKIIEEIIHFEISVIQQQQLRLSPAMVGIFLLTPFHIIKSKEDFYYKFNKSSEYLHTLMQYRNTLIMDRLPTFLKVFRILLSDLCAKCSESEEIDRLANCAHQLEKIVRHLVFYKKHVARIAPHLIADILKEYELSTMYPKVKIHLNNCIYSLISVCDNHAVSYSLRVLSSASTELFKMMYENYNKFYRFKGKV